MFQRIKNMFMGFDDNKLSEVMYDIDLFYNYLRKNSEHIDEWYFRNVFTADYCRYLKKYSCLDANELIYLHRGVLSLLLFKFYQIIESGSYDLLNNKEQQIMHSLESFTPSDPLTLKLRRLAYTALKLIEKSMKKGVQAVDKSEALKSIGWALRNIVLTNEPSNVKRIER